MNMLPRLSRRIHAQSARGMMRSLVDKKGRGGRFLWLFVLIPTILLGIYLTFFFSNMYISESSFALRSNEQQELPGIVGMLLPTSSSTGTDSYIVQMHISSMDMLEKIEKRIDIQKHYSDRSKDIYSRLWARPTREEFLKYWQWAVSAVFDMDKGIITLQVKAYTPEMAQTLNAAILEVSEELVNQMNVRAHEDSISRAKKEVAMAEERVLASKDVLQGFRDTTSMLDPAVTAASLEGVVAGLEVEAAKVQAELTGILRVMHRESPRVRNLETKLQGLHDQITKEKSRLAGQGAKGRKVSSLVGDYKRLRTEEEFAQQQLVSAMSAFEVARVKAIAQSRYIVPFQPPILPQESLYPRPVLFTFLGFMGLFILLGICSLVLAAIRDHIGV